MIPLAAFALATCLAIDAPADHIRAADLARLLLEWQTVAPDAPIALAPLPGVNRVLHIPELRALATRWNVVSDPAGSACFTRVVAPVAPERMLEAMRRQLPDARIDLIESSRYPAPDGALEFPLRGLRAGYWYGHVAYGGTHRFTIWARVNVTVAVKRIVAAADLSPGEPIDPAHVRFDVREAPWTRSPSRPLESVDDIAGWIPRRHIPAGAPIEKQWLEAPKLVHRGDPVKVEIIAGAATLHLDAVAETPGALGDLISVQNPDSKRRFRALVEGKGRVSVKGAR
jgi:flagella basal body P-ring formation protein FlgA